MTLEEQQKGPGSSSTVPNEGEEGDWVLEFSRLKIGTRDRQQINHKDSLEEKKGQVTHNIRAPRTGGGEGGRSWSWGKTKDRERHPGNKGSRKPHHGTAERTPQDWRENTSGEKRSGAQVRSPERTQSQWGTKNRENSPRREGRASRRPQGGEAEKTTPDRGAAEPPGQSVEELQRESRKERQEGPSEERQEDSSREKAVEGSPRHLIGPGGGGAPRSGGRYGDSGEDGDIKQHKVRKESVEGPTRKQQENSTRSKELESHRKDHKKKCTQGQPEKRDRERKPP